MQYTPRERERERGTERCSLAGYFAVPPAYLYLYLYLICSRLSYRTCCIAACLVLVFQFRFRLWFWGLSVDFGLHCWHLALAFFQYLFLPALLTWALVGLAARPHLLFSSVAGVNLLLFVGRRCCRCYCFCYYL